MMKLILSALGLTVVTVIIHGVGTVAATGRVARLWTGSKDRLGRLGTELLMAQLVSMLLLVHLAEAVVWALFFVLVGGLPDLESAVVLLAHELHHRRLWRRGTARAMATPRPDRGGGGSADAGLVHRHPRDGDRNDLPGSYSHP